LEDLFLSFQRPEFQLVVGTQPALLELNLHVIQFLCHKPRTRGFWYATAPIQRWLPLILAIVVGQCTCEGHELVVRADAKTIRRLDRRVVDSAVHDLCEYLSMKNK
jgi:hypothetical protein